MIIITTIIITINITININIVMNIIIKEAARMDPKIPRTQTWDIPSP